MTVNASFDYRYLILMALTFVLGWESHALWISLDSDKETTEKMATEAQEDTGVFSEDGQSMLSEEETEVILSYQIKPGDTFSSVLERYGVRFPIKTSRECAEHFDISKIREGQSFVIEQHGGITKQIEFAPNSYQKLIIRLEPEADVVEFTEAPITTKSEVLSLDITSTFWEACTAVGLGPQTIIQLAKSFEHHVDFATELQAGAILDAVIDGNFANDTRVSVEKVHALRLKNAGKSYSFFRFATKDGDKMLDMDGRTIGRPFLRSPLEYIRITSQFGVKRKTGYHGGIDFGAPTGTPVRAVADGIVTWAKWNGNYGNHVKVKHDKYGPYETSYSHLSKIKVKKGQRIKQGTIVGLVGSTGRSTGPHLHYEMKIKGKRVHPLKQDLPYMDPISAAQKPAFMAARDILIEVMDSQSLPETGLP